jgi:hypothetical protein
MVVEKGASRHQFLRVWGTRVFDFCCSLITGSFGLSDTHSTLARGSLLTYAFDIARVFDFG